ncbi:MA3 domain protein [Dictyocaulus viviparus]|uniref:MA3 domain protein n=1 Tax=Dictyocaulus viviparus TaxID=29172 RepID=A0A0D8Y4M3_DICVI|nr:MA3 domain protein [Dictyocaulus viviparus]
MGLKKWVSVVKSGRKETSFASRKQDRKQAKFLKKLQHVAASKHQPIEKVLEEVFCNKKKKRRMITPAQIEEEKKVERYGCSVKRASETKRPKKRCEVDDSNTDSDADLTYDQFLREVQDKKRKLAMEKDDEKQDDIDIHRYSKLLGIKERGKTRRPKSFANDGLDYLLDFCDEDARKRILASSTDQEIALKGRDLNEEDDNKEDRSNIEENILEESHSSSEYDNECNKSHAGSKHISASENDMVMEEAVDEDEIDDFREDIYGRTVNKRTGQVVESNFKGARKKLADLEAIINADESKKHLDRILMGTMNRLSEGTVVKSQQVLSELWQKHSKNDVKSCLCSILSRLISAPYRLQDQLLSLYALFLSYTHAFTSDEISAHFLEVFLLGFIDEICHIQATDDKKLENCSLVKGTLILEVLKKLREQLSVYNLQLIVLISQYSYKVLRRQLWSAFSQELSNVLENLKMADFYSLPKAKFLGDTLMAIQKSHPTNIDFSIIDHHVNLLHGLRKNIKSSSDRELGMSLDDILHADERGRWWIVGSAYQVANGNLSARNSAATSRNAQNFPDEVLQLARKAKMNSDVRRSVFCTTVISEDEDDAFEHLMRLSLKGKQEREIIYVLMMMLLKEKNFNSFYPSLIAKFCEFDKRFTLTTQYSLWDRIREVDTIKLQARTHLADLIHYLISHEVISITVLKIVEWGTLTAAVSSVIRRVFKLLLSSPIQKLRRIFSPIFMKDKNPLLSEGIRLFLSVNFPDSESYQQIEEIFTRMC